MGMKTLGPEVVQPRERGWGGYGRTSLVLRLLCPPPPGFLTLLPAEMMFLLDPVLTGLGQSWSQGSQQQQEEASGSWDPHPWCLKGLEKLGPCSSLWVL